MNRRWMIGASCLLILGLGAWWLRSKTARVQQVTVTGVLPAEPGAQVHVVFPDLHYELSKPASELGQPGQPYHWVVDVPGPPGRMQLETRLPELPRTGGVPIAMTGRVIRAPAPATAPSLALPSVSPASMTPQQLARRERLRKKRKLLREALRGHRRNHGGGRGRGDRV